MEVAVAALPGLWLAKVLRSVVHPRTFSVGGERLAAAVQSPRLKPFPITFHLRTFICRCCGLNLEPTGLPFCLIISFFDAVRASLSKQMSGTGGIKPETT